MNPILAVDSFYQPYFKPCINLCLSHLKPEPYYPNSQSYIRPACLGGQTHGLGIPIGSYFPPLKLRWFCCHHFSSQSLGRMEVTIVGLHITTHMYMCPVVQDFSRQLVQKPASPGWLNPEPVIQPRDSAVKMTPSTSRCRLSIFDIS